MQTYRIVFDADDYLEHHGVKGQKWGVIRTPQQLGHKKPKKTYEFKPYRTAMPDVIEYLAGPTVMPFRILSEKWKRTRDPEYKKKSDEFINQHRDELLRRYLWMSPYDDREYLLANEIGLAYERKHNPYTREHIRNQVKTLKSDNPDITLSKIARQLGVSKSYLRKLESDS